MSPVRTRITAAEASRAIETAQHGEAEFLVLDVESEFKGHPEAAADVCQRIRETLGPDCPLYFSCFAIVDARVERLESEVTALSGSASPPPAPTPRTYTVQSGDTLSGIAQKLGLAGWQALYRASAGVIGGDPNKTYLGQVLVLPEFSISGGGAPYNHLI